MEKEIILQLQSLYKENNDLQNTCREQARKIDVLEAKVKELSESSKSISPNKDKIRKTSAKDAFIAFALSILVLLVLRIIQ